MNPWILLTDDFPPDDELVFLQTAHTIKLAGFYCPEAGDWVGASGQLWTDIDPHLGEITHWQPMPAELAVKVRRKWRDEMSS